MNENSAKNLIPFVKGMDERRAHGAWPGWRKALRHTIGDGEQLFQKLNDLAMGIPQMPVYPKGHEKAGQPLMIPVFVRGMQMGQAPLVVEVPPAVQKAAASELLDRAFGKPVQVVIDASTGDEEGRESYIAASELTEGELTIARAIAKRVMLGRMKAEEVEPPTAETVPNSEQEQT